MDTRHGHAPDSLYAPDTNNADLMLGRLLLWVLIAAVAVWLFLTDNPNWTGWHWAAGIGNTALALYLAAKD